MACQTGPALVAVILGCWWQPLERSRLTQCAVGAMSEHQAHNAAHIIANVKEILF